MSSNQARRRWIGLAGVTALTAALVVGVVTPSDAATKKAATTVSLSAITHEETEIYTGDEDVIVSGDRADVTGTASPNLVGKNVLAQVKVVTGKRSRWVTLGSAVVSPSKAFSIRVRPSGLGSTTFRVLYAGSAKLTSSSGTTTTSLSRWFPLVSMSRAGVQQSTSGNAPHAVKHLVVAGKQYAAALAGTSLGASSASSDFWVDRRCSQMATTIGPASGSPKGAIGTFTISVDGTQHSSQDVPLGTATLVDGVGLAGIRMLRLENSATVPPGSNPTTATVGWPGAEVLCTSTPKPRPVQ